MFGIAWLFEREEEGCGWEARHACKVLSSKEVMKACKDMPPACQV